jgi:hypothetical protein
LPIEALSGGRTKYNRSRLGIAKSHALDPACVGEVGTLVGWQIPSTEIKATGRGDYCRTNLDRHGFLRGYYTRAKRVCGFQTSDMVRAALPNGAAKGWAALRCVSPALSESATRTEATPSTANFFTARTAIVMPGASSPAERALRLEHPRGGAANLGSSAPVLVAFGAAVFAGERLDWVAVLGRLLVGGASSPTKTSVVFAGAHRACGPEGDASPAGRVPWGAMIANGLRSARTASPIGMPLDRPGAGLCYGTDDSNRMQIG